MRPESSVAAHLWDALDFARNLQIAVDHTSLETQLGGGPVAWATERQIELVGEALTTSAGRLLRLPSGHLTSTRSSACATWSSTDAPR
jgi:hypothetical protein